MMLLVDECRGSVLVQDLGRPHGWRVGVGESGSFDRTAHVAGQRLVGNPADCAALELTLGTIGLVAGSPCTVAVTGAACAVSVDGAAVGHGVAIALPRGSRLHIGAPTAGLRVTVSVAGGIQVDPVLGSRSRDTLAAIGPPPIAAGDELVVGPPAGRPSWRGVVLPSEPIESAAADAGPHIDQLASTTLLATVSADGNRAGVRLDTDGALGTAGDLASFPVFPGAVQLTPSGQLIVLGPDAGITGGYPVLGVLARDVLGRLGQCRPGQRVELRFSRSRAAR